ncbi:Nucleoporin p58/p45 [Ancistrocladus abbreviatus]
MSFSLFSTPPQQQQSPFQSQPQQQFQIQQQQLQQQQQQLFLFTKERTPATYGTKWDDLHPDSQKVLLQIEERILEYRDESQRLDQCTRLFDSSVSNDAFQLDAGHIGQELGGITTAMERQKALLQELMTVVKDMLRNTEVAVWSFMMLRPRFLHAKAGAVSNATAPSKAPGATTAPTTSQPAANTIVPVFDFYSGLPKKPSPFLQQTVVRFEKHLGECQQWIEELEQLLRLYSDQHSYSSNLSLLQSLPEVMSNVHDFFVHVAAKVESIHQYVESMKTAYLADKRWRGEGNDPFLEADRREIARQEAAARRVHPTLHLPSMPQPSTQGAGLFASSATPGLSTTPQTSAALLPSSSVSGISLVGTSTSSPLATMTSSLFSTPTTPPTSSLFASPVASPQTPLFGSSLASGLGSTPSLFGGVAPSSGSAPAAGALFATGAATGSGASFGAVSRSTKAKLRSGRR